MILDRAVYKRNKHKNRNLVLSFISKIVFFVFIIYGILVNYIILSYDTKSAAMEPAIHSGDKLFVSPINYGYLLPIYNKKFSFKYKPERGEIVIIQTARKIQFPGSVVNFIVNFFTFNQVHNQNTSPDILIKRIIGIPGDTVQLANNQISIKSINGTEFLSEASLNKRGYNVNTFGDQEMLNSVLLSFQNEITLKANEYLVLEDYRSQFNNPNPWEIIKVTDIIGKVLFRYFPFNRLGIPK